ncbi:hypothetical protein V1506DRAFT_561805 [Lipomyces tetrasporus]
MSVSNCSQSLLDMILHPDAYYGVHPVQHLIDECANHADEMTSSISNSSSYTLERRYNVACHSNHGAYRCDCTVEEDWIHGHLMNSCSINTRKSRWCDSHRSCAIVANNRGRSRSTFAYGREVLTKAIPIIDTCWSQYQCDQLKSGVIQVDNTYPKWVAVKSAWLQIFGYVLEEFTYFKSFLEYNSTAS